MIYVFRILCAWLCLFAISPAQAATPAQIDAARAEGLMFLFNRQSGEGNWSSAPGLALPATAATLEAMAEAGIGKGHAYVSALAWLSNQQPASTDGIARQIVALSRAGADVSAHTARLLAMRNDVSKSWGAYSHYQGSFPDTALALDAILITGTPYADTGFTLGFMTGKKNADGGWSYVAPAPGTAQSRVVPTAYNVLSLSRHRAVGWSVNSSITAGVNWLVSQQKADGGFADDPAAATGAFFETALVHLAISAAQTAGNSAAQGAQTALDDARDFLIGAQQANGSWNDDVLLTALALQSLPDTVLADSEGDGLPDSVEVLLGTDPNTPDGRFLAKGNGRSVVGISAPVIVATATLDESFSHFLAVSGGTPPYSWDIESGSLPVGLSLNGVTGEISGIPTALGAFNFIYSVADINGDHTATTSQIAVTAPAEVFDEEIPTLPEWGMIIMGTILFMSMVMANRRRAGGV